MMNVRDKECTALFGFVPREVFTKVSDRIESDAALYACMTIEYEGTNLFGDMALIGRPGYRAEFLKALQIFIEEYSKR